MSSKSYEENGYWHNLDLLIILHLRVIHLMRNGCNTKSVTLKHAYLIHAPLMAMNNGKLGCIFPILE
jgi:hypothetical protein